MKPNVILLRVFALSLFLKTGILQMVITQSVHRLRAILVNAIMLSIFAQYSSSESTCHSGESCSEAKCHSAECRYAKRHTAILLQSPCVQR